MRIRNPFRDLAIQRFPSFHHEHPTYRWWVLGTVLLTTFMSVLESTIVNTALPKMQNAFGTNLDTIEWVLTAFQLVFAVVLPLSGWLADKMGYKRTFLLSLAFFTLGSFLCSFAWNESILIIFRVVQGFGAGMIMPVGMAIVTREFPPKQRGLAMGFYGIAAAASVSLGPSLGGFLTDSYGWSSVFLVNVPFGMLAILATLIIQREMKKPHVGAFDWPGFLSIGGFLVSLLLALADGNAAWNTGGWSSPFILSCFALSAFCLVVFLIVEFRVPHPIVNLRLFQNWNFGLSNILLFVLGLVLTGSTFLMPIYLQGTLGYTALQSGLIFLPLGLIQGAISPVAGILSDRMNPKIPAMAGILILLVSFSMNTLLSVTPPKWIIDVPVWLRGAGFGLLFISFQAVAINSLPKDQMAQGSALISLTRQVGSSFGVAIFGTFVSVQNTLHSTMAGEAMSPYSEVFQSTVGQLRQQIPGSSGGSPGDAVTWAQALISKEMASRAFVQSVCDAFLLVAVMVALCAIPLLLLKVGASKKSRTPGEKSPEVLSME